MDNPIRPIIPGTPPRPVAPRRQPKEGDKSFEDELEKRGEEASATPEAPSAGSKPEPHKPTDDESGSILDITG